MIGIVAQKRQEIAAACRRHQVRRLELFGSAGRNSENFTPKSDVDFAVEFGDPGSQSPLAQYIDLQSELANILGTPVDLVEECAVRNPYFRRSIEQSRELVFAA
jgi:uncharacterized protein